MKLVSARTYWRWSIRRFPAAGEGRDLTKGRPMPDRSGTVIAGDRRAQFNHRVLIPQLGQLFPEIAACRPYGTINLQWDDALRKDFADFWTGQITWRPVTSPRI